MSSFFQNIRLPHILIILLFGLMSHQTDAQSGTEFWLAPPDITDLHNAPGGVPLYLLVSSTGQASTVTIEQPANGSFTPIVVNVAANKSVRVNLTSFKSMLETRPTNTVVNTGLHITSTTSITCYYECANVNNTDIWALKGPNAEGTEFYIPLHKHAPFNNEASFASPNQAFASFDICATQNNTVVTIYSPTPVDGHAALQQFTVNLNRGQTYSCGFTGTNWSQPSTHPSGAIVLSNLPITVSLKDDSDHNPSGGCYDILGDQIVPTDVVGEDYIAVKGSLNNNGDESVVLMATQNNTQVYVDGSASPIATLFAGEYYRIDMDSLSTSANNALYIHCTKPTYAMHITGFGCEMGMAQLPPLNCAGSQQLNFLRDDAQTFYITVLCRAAAVNGFSITGPGTATIPPASFVTVPGTGGVWKAARITYNTTQVPVDSTFKVSNSIDVFALGVVNGGATSGCKYGYFSEFVAPIVAFAGTDQTICANTSATLAGTVSGGTITGIWTSSGTGSFTPNNTTLNAVYTPSAADAAMGNITLTLTSTGACNPVSDAMVLTITPAPTVNAGADQTKCSNNPNTSLSGSVTVATGGVWTGGAGSFIPANNVLNPVYVPTASEINSGSIALTLTSTGNGICNPISDNIVITFTPSPVVNAGADQTLCGNNPGATLSGSITVATGGVWTGGGGSFSPSATSLNPVYTATQAEINAGSVTLTLTSTGNGSCNSVSDQMTIFFSAPPVITAGADQTKCANNAVTTLAGNVSGAAGGQWSGGLGTFSPNSTSPMASYSPTAAEIANGSVTLTYTTTGNGLCNAVNDQITIFFTAAPTSDAGINQTVCANNPQVNLSGSFTVATGATWGGGTGNFSPSNTSLNVSYTPSSAEITVGVANIILTTTGNGTCNAVTDPVTITITPSPVVNAGSDQTRCGNNPSATLAGSITTASGGIWSGGAGTFNPSSSALNAVYTATVAEIANGSVILTLTSTGNGSCAAVSDQMTIFFSASPTANAGNDVVLCSNNPTTTLAGNVSIASGGQWTGGLGIFLPNNNTLNATYTPTASEILNGSVSLTLTTTGNNSCNAVSDVMTISFTPAPTVNAGADQSVCGNNAVVALTGSFTTATGAAWTGAGTFLPNTTTLNATYTPTASEIASGSATITLTSTGNGLCNTVSDQMAVIITPSPTANAGIDQTKCANNPDATLSGSITVATGGIWSGGAGVFNPSASALNAVYSPSATEIANGSVTLTLTTVGNGNCNAVSDQVTIHFSSPPTVNAGIDQTLCANNSVVTLNGIVTTAGGAQWSGGLGVFSPNSTTLNATYTPSATELAAGNLALTLTTTGNGGCNAVSDAIILFFTPAPTASAGADISICANNSLVNLNGAFTISSGVSWSGGSGTYGSGNTSAVTSYQPSQSEIIAGTANLTITTTGNGTCSPVSDNISITILPSPIVDAGSNISACANNSTVSLSGQVFNAIGGVWSGGSGSFFPNSATLNASYTPSNAELSNGSVTLTLTSTGNGNCNSVSDQVTITYAPSPTSFAGADQTLCGNNATAELNGSVNFSTGGQWTGGLGVFSPSSTATGASYTPTAGEIATGFVELILSTTGNGTCIAERDTMRINYTPAPTANAGSDMTSCANNPAITLNGNYTLAGGAIWTGGNGTFLPSNTTINASYTPSAAEISAGNVTLILTTTSNGNCLPATDQMQLVISPSPVVNAGADQITCINNLNIGLSGSISGITNTGIWSTSGTGTFIPNATTLNATYQCSVNDVSNGGAILTLTSTNNSTCNAVSDNMIITILPPGSAQAGNDMTVCANNSQVTLNGNVSGGASTGVWGSTGTGSFVPDNSSLNTTYIPSAFDKLNGGVSLYLLANSCNFASDTLHVVITPAPQVIAGQDITICSTQNSVDLSGTISGGSSSGIWTSTGTGTFTPNNATLNAQYIPSAADNQLQQVTLILTSSNNGLCQPVADSLILYIYPAGTSNAGSDQTLCANNANVSLSGTLGNGSTQGQWSTSGDGVFTPNNSTLNANYIPGNNDLLNGSVTLALLAVNSCNNASDDIAIDFTSAPQVNAGSDLISCANNPAIALDGTFSVATGIAWSGGNGVFTSGINDATTTYLPSNAEISSGNVILQITTTGNANCNSVTDEVQITITPSPAVNAGQDQNTCVNDLSISLSGTVTGVTGTGAWSSTGTGIFSPSNTALNATYILSSADSVAGNVMLTLTSTNNGTCLPVSDDMWINIVPVGTADAGENMSVCSNHGAISLNGVIGGGASSGNWTTNGTGVFSPNTSTLNAIYIPSAFDLENGEVTLTLTANTCSSATDEIQILFTPAPEVQVGNDITICANQSAVDLAGNVSGGSTTGIWTTSGDGAFQPSSSDLNASYIPGNADVVNQEIILILTSTQNGLCLPVSDSLTLHIYPTGSADAGSPITLCSNNANALLNGMIAGGATEGIWSSNGSGSFIPNANALNATYVPSAEDLLNGGVTLYLLATNSCNNANDFVNITYTAAPTAIAGEDQSLCGGNPQFNLNGSVTIAIGGSWNSGAGIFSPSNNVLNATYTFSDEEITAGFATLVLSTTENGTCNAVSDTLTLFYSTNIISNAGSDQQVCISSDSTQLSGMITNGASSGIWTTSGSGSFSPDANDLNTYYLFSAADKLAGEVVFTLSSVNNGDCPVASDTMIVSFGQSAFAEAGNGYSICASQQTISLNGFVSGGATQGMWSASGSGTFNPVNTDLQTQYNITANDIANGQLDFVLTTTDNGACQAGVDTVTYFIQPVSAVSVGEDIQTCSNQLIVPVGGNISGASISGIWTTSGSGSFSPDNTTLNASYHASATDVLNGSVNIILTSTNTGVCSTASDTLQIEIESLPVVNAGVDQEICGANTQISLSGSSDGNAIVWNTNGGGVFLPDNTTLNAQYQISSTDILNGQLTFILISVGSGICPAVTDTMHVQLQSPSQVFAGADRDVCSSDPNAVLQGNISGTSSAIVWTTTGSGIFIPDNHSLNATYQASNGDITIGNVALVLSLETPTGCGINSDTLQLNIQKIATVVAGNDQSLCSTNTEVQLNGTTTGDNIQSSWTTTGAGTFDPDPNDPNASYTIASNDIAQGAIQFVLHATNDGVCPEVTDTMLVTIIENAQVSAGSDLSICMSDLTVPLAGNVNGGTTSGAWSTLGSGTFSPDNTTLNATYYPSANDSISGEVILILTSTNNGICQVVTDNVLISFDSPSVANAGSDQTLCADTEAITLLGNVTGGSATGIWNSSGSGNFAPDNTSLNANYIPSPSDVLNGEVSFTLTSTGNGVCSPSVDVVNVTFVQSAQVFAGANQVLCGAVSDVALNGIITGSATNGIWTTNGSGTFNPGPTSLSTIYSPGNSDLNQGEIELILQSTGNSICPAVSDTLLLLIEENPIAAFSAVSGDELDIQFTDESIGASQWFWDFGVGGNSTESDPLVIYPEASDYSVTLIITNDAGCVDTSTSIVKAIESIGTPVAIPSGFSPNGDNSNDVLHVLGGPFKEVDFRIYNEWGNLVYSTTDPNGGWDGTYRGELQPGGVYVYTATGTTVKGRFVKLSGNVTLIR